MPYKLWRIKLKTLLLFRHASANHFEENTEDHEKELNEEGIKESLQLADWIKKSQIKVDKVFSSSAKRATSTAEVVFKDNSDFIIDRSLYLCDYLVILKIINEQTDSISNLAIIGHEPSLSETLNFLVGNSRPDLISVKNKNYPTAGLAIINFNVLSWHNIIEKSGILDAFVTSEYLDHYNEKN